MQIISQTTSQVVLKLSEAEVVGIRGTLGEACYTVLKPKQPRAVLSKFPTCKRLREQLQFLINQYPRTFTLRFNRDDLRLICETILEALVMWEEEEETFMRFGISRIELESLAQTLEEVLGDQQYIEALLETQAV